MKERPIIFKDEMVIAILDGRKIQTRRVIKPQPSDSGLECVETKEGFSAFVDRNLNLEERRHRLCPYGHSGDRLWVREGFDAREPVARYMADNSMLSVGHARLKPKIYPAIHMPRWASRITLEITSVRVERLKDITDTDCDAEGTDYFFNGNVSAIKSIRGRFSVMWDCINAKRGYAWESNPWVFVLEFRKLGNPGILNI